MSAVMGAGSPNSRTFTFLAPDGRAWTYSGKIGRVLDLLARCASGITQFDCLPWHTRLGGSIHRLREDGLVIETRREGDCHHARYFLRTEGRLLEGVEGRP